MKKLRRVEITAFRRRTTIVWRDGSEGGPAVPQPGEDKASPLAHAGTARAAESDLDQTQTGVPDGAGHLGLVRDANDRQSI